MVGLTRLIHIKVNSTLFQETDFLKKCMIRVFLHDTFAMCSYLIAAFKKGLSVQHCAVFVLPLCPEWVSPMMAEWNLVWNCFFFRCILIPSAPSALWKVTGMSLWYPTSLVSHNQHCEALAFILKGMSFSKKKILLMQWHFDVSVKRYTTSTVWRSVCSN